MNFDKFGICLLILFFFLPFLDNLLNSQVLSIIYILFFVLLAAWIIIGQKKYPQNYNQKVNKKKGKWFAKPSSKHDYYQLYYPFGVITSWKGAITVVIYFLLVVIFIPGILFLFLIHIYPLIIIICVYLFILALLTYLFSLLIAKKS